MANARNTDRQTTTESIESTDSRSPGNMTGSLLGRIIAVTLFIGLGTFAVAQSVTGNKHTGDGDGVETQPIAQVSSFEAPKIENGGAFAGAPKPKSFDSKPNSFGAKLPAAKPDNGFATNIKSAGFPTKKNGFNANPFPNAKKAADSAIKLAQSAPEIKGGFEKPPSLKFGGNKNINSLKPATAQTTAGQTAKSLADSVTNQFQVARQKATGAFDSAANQIGDAGANLKTAASDGLRNIGKSASNLLPSGTTKPKLPAIETTQVSTQSSFPGAKPPASQNSIPRNFLPNQPKTPAATISNPAAKSSAAFDSSRDLQPIGQQSNDRFAGSQPRQTTPSRPSLPTMNNRQNMQAPNAVRNNGNNNLNRRPPGVQSKAALSNPPTRRPPVTQVAAATMLTKPTPGEKQLDGVQAPSVSIEKIAPPEIQLNQPADFTLIVKNIGRVAANNVRVFDEIPSGTQFLEANPQPNRSSAGRVDWNFGTMQPGQEKRIKLKLKPTRPGEMGSVAQVTFAAQASMRTRVTKPEISIFHKCAPKVLVGDRVAFDIVVKNDGDGPATNVMIQEDLPPQLEFAQGYRELEYAIGSLAPGQSKNINLVLKAAEIGPFRNTMVAHADGGLQDQHSIDMEVIAPKLQITADGPNRRFMNRQTKHVFSVSNVGTAKATNVELVCQLPAGLKYVGTNNQGKYDPSSHAVFWSLAQLAEQVTASVEVETSPIEPGTQNIKFDATADLERTASLTRPLSVQHLVDVFFDIDDVVDPIEVNSETSYKIRVVNQGTKTAANVMLRVNFPPGIKPTSVDSNLPNDIRDNLVAFAPITSMNPGDEISITVNAQGKAPGDHKVIVNLAADGRQADVAKQETTHVYSDQ